MLIPVYNQRIFFRYTSSSSLPRENCYLSIKDFKQLDNYIDLEPDKDFDVYTMNNLARCEQPLIDRKVESGNYCTYTHSLTFTILVCFRVLLESAQQLPFR